MSRFIRETVNSFTAGKSIDDGSYAEGLEQAGRKILDLANTKDKIKKMWNLDEMFCQFVNYPGSQLAAQYGSGSVRAEMSVKEIANAATASQFPKITKTLIHQVLMESYELELGAEEIPFLVTEVQSDKERETIGGVESAGEPELTLEAQQYPAGKPIEKDVEIRNHKFGRTLAFTKELMLFDKTGGQIMDRAEQFGEKGGRHRRRWIFEALTDVAITATGQAVNTVWNYKGATASVYANDHTAQYNRANDNLQSTLLGEVGMNDAFTLLQNMTDFWGSEIVVRGEVLIIPSGKISQAVKLMNSDGGPDTTNTDINAVKTLGWIRRVITDPVLDGQSQTVWYYGRPNKMLRWQWVWEPMTVDEGAQPSKDIIMNLVYSYMGGLGVIDPLYMVKSNAST